MACLLLPRALLLSALAALASGCTLNPVPDDPNNGSGDSSATDSSTTSGTTVPGGTSVATGTSTATSSSGGAPDTCALTSATGALSITDGRVAIGNLGGYAYAGAAWFGDEMTPCEEKWTEPATAICAEGITGTGSAPSVLGVTVNQTAASDTAVPWPEAVESILLDWTYTGAAPLLLEVAAGDPAQRFCVRADGLTPGAPIPASSFLLNCAAGGTTAWDGTGLRDIALLVSSDANSAQPFSLCLTNVAIINAP